MNRRELILMLGSALAVPRAVNAQRKTMPVIGFLGSAEELVHNSIILWLR